MLALDLTARNLQAAAKKAGNPWSVAKVGVSCGEPQKRLIFYSLPFTQGYDTFCPVSAFVAKERLADPQNVRLWCEVNDTKRQDGNTRDMIFTIPQLISVRRIGWHGVVAFSPVCLLTQNLLKIQHISSIFTLEPGDLILTGTPDGVGPIAAGQTIKVCATKTPLAQDCLLSIILQYRPASATFSP